MTVPSLPWEGTAMPTPMTSLDWGSNGRDTGVDRIRAVWRRRLASSIFAYRSAKARQTGLGIWKDRSVLARIPLSLSTRKTTMLSLS